MHPFVILCEFFCACSCESFCESPPPPNVLSCLRGLMDSGWATAHSQQIMQGNHQKITYRNHYLNVFISPWLINHREGKTHYSFTFLGRNNYLIFFIYPGFINHHLRLRKNIIMTAVDILGPGFRFPDLWSRFQGGKIT